jgi:hypothetical protein
MIFICNMRTCLAYPPTATAHLYYLHVHAKFVLVIYTFLHNILKPPFIS